MLPQRRVLAVAVLAAMLLPLAVAQDPPVPVPGGGPQTPEQLQCQPGIDTCQPDLVPSNPRIDIRDERFPGTACTDFVNLGEGPSATPFRILLSIDGAPVGEQQATGVYRRGEGEANLCWSDLTLAAGRHTMTILVDSNGEVIESGENNNERAVTFTVKPTPRVDLRLTNFQVTPKDGGVGMNQLFIVNVSNVGDAGAPLSVISLEDDHGVMANWSVPPLAPGQSWVMAHATRPEYRPVGTFIARATVDPLDNLSEIREDNNEALLEYTVLEHPAPDYNISKVTISGNRTSLRGIRVDVVVDNIGDRAIGGTTVRLVNQNNMNKTVAQGYTRSIIHPTQSATVQFYLTLKAGIYNLSLVADPNNKIIERNESNNAWPIQIEILELPYILDRPNLVVERVYAMPEDPRPGEAVSVGALIHNIGTNRSNSTTVSFFVDDEPIGNAQVPALAEDAYYSAYIPWITREQGAYRITAAVDHTDRVPEIEEADNALDLDFLVTIERPPQQEPPTQPPPVVITPPTSPTGPSPTTPPPPTPPPANTSTAGRVLVGDLIVSTKAVPGGVKGVISASLRNPNIATVPRLIVQFKVDGEIIPDSEKLVAGIRGAATTAVTTGEIDLPPGKHRVSAEVRIIGSTGAPVVSTGEYEQEAGEKGGIPGFETLALVVALGLAMTMRRRTLAR